jgi:lipoate-protein ligase A
MLLPQNIGDWIVIDSGVKTGEEHMAIDRFALNLVLNNPNTRPLLRFFQWAQPTVTYGYLLDPIQVETWAKDKGPCPLVKRPSGGGAVHHQENDLSLSLLWPRQTTALSDNPRACYAEIHEALQQALLPFLKEEKKSISLFKKEGLPPSCQPIESSRFSVCFQEPVCNDVMVGDKKIIGGALRLTRNAVLYQGHIENTSIPVGELKAAIVRSLEPLLTQTKELAPSL